MFPDRGKLSIVINGKDYWIHSTWNGIDLENLIKACTLQQELAALSNIPIEVLNSATDESLWPLYTVISFIDSPQIYEVHAVSVALGKYEEIEQAKKYLRGGRVFRQLINVAKVYYPDETDPLKLLSLGANLTKQIEVFLSQFKDMIEEQPTGEEERAGASDLAAFESFGTVMSLAQDDITKMRAIFAMPAQEVYLSLRYAWVKNKYQKALMANKTQKPN